MLSMLLLLSTGDVDFESKVYSLFTVQKDDNERKLK